MADIVMIPVAQLHPHPDNPRKELGDLTELADSIRENGVFQNLTVIPGHWMTQEEWKDISAQYKENPTEELRMKMNQKWLDTEYTVVIGHRRSAAAKLAGCMELPCMIADMDRKKQITTMALENMQRTDLTVFEQAQCFQMMIDMGQTEEEISTATGFSKATIKRRLKMAELDQRVLKEVSNRQISLGDFDSLAKIDSMEERNKVLQHIGTPNFKMEYERSFKRQQIAKKLPSVKAALKQAKAKKLEQRDTWYGKYTEICSAEVNIHELADDANIIPTSDEKLFYYLDESSGRLRFYNEVKRAAPVKRPQEEIDREKAIKLAHEELEELDSITRKLRESFVKELRYTSKNGVQMIKGAVDACIYSAFIYNSMSSQKLFDAVGLERKYNDAEKWELFQLLEQHTDREVPLVIYLAFCDTNEIYHTNYKSDWPRYQKNLRLEKLYDWLISLGYVMSDDERALKDGTHELLHRGEVKA